MSQKLAKRVRKQIPDWAEKWYDIIDHPFNVVKPWNMPGQTFQLNPACGRSRYQVAKAAA